MSQPLGPLALSGLGDVLEVSLAVVAEEVAAADGRDVEVGVAVVVVVADGHALAVERLVEPGFLRHVLEVPLAVVAVEGLGRRWCGLVLMARPGARVDEEQVLVAVAVVVEERDAGAHRLGQELLAVGAVEVDERDPGFLGDVDELHGRQGLGLDLRRAHGRHGLGDDGLLGPCAAARGREGQEIASPSRAQEPGGSGHARFMSFSTLLSMNRVRWSSGSARRRPRRQRVPRRSRGLRGGAANGSRSTGRSCWRPGHSCGRSRTHAPRPSRRA